MKVVFTDEFHRQLSAIAEFIAQDSPTRAATFVDSMESKCLKLSSFPKRGRIVPEFAREDDSLREIIVGNYRAIYRLTPGMAVFLSVFHARQQIPK